jgi:hypothetical protein
MNASALKRLREKILSRNYLEGEFSRAKSTPGTAEVTAGRHKGYVIFDLSPLMFPEVRNGICT